MQLMHTQEQRRFPSTHAWLWGVVLGVLGLMVSSDVDAMVIGSPARDAWQSKDRTLTYIRASGQIWRKYKDGKLSPHVYHEFRHNGQFVALYDLKRHLMLRLYRGALLARSSFRPGLMVWILSKPGTWVDLDWYRRKALAGRLAKRPASKRPAAPTSRRSPPVPRTRQRPVPRPTSPRQSAGPSKARPTSGRRPASRRGPASRPMIRRSRPPARRKVAAKKAPVRLSIPQLLGLPPMPRHAERRLVRHYAWLSSKGKRRLQQVAGRLWRELQGGELTDHRYLEVRRNGRSVWLFEPEGKRWLQLDAQRCLARRKEASWQLLTTGRWARRRASLRVSWVERKTRARFHRVKGALWVTYMAGKPIRVRSFWRRDANDTYIGLRNKSAEVRIYEHRAFARMRRGASPRWRLLGKGSWDPNPPLYQPNGWMRRLLRLRARRRPRTVTTPRRATQRPPARRKAPRRVVARKAPAPRRPQARAIAPRSVVAARPRPKAPPRRPKARAKTLARRRAPAKRATSGDQRVRVKHPKRAPWRSVAFVRVKKRDGSKTFASGVLIGERLLLTSGHVIYDRSKKKTASSLWVYPGLYGRTMPFGATYPVRWAVHPKWINASSAAEANNHDLAIAWLKKPLGRKAGWLNVKANASSETRQKAMTLAAYPLDKFFRTKKLWIWRSTHRGHASGRSSYPWKHRIATRHTVSKGADGGPLLMRVGKKWAVVGICRRGGRSRAEFVRLSAEHVTWIRAVVARWTRGSRPTLDPFSGGDEPPAQLRFWEGEGLDLEQLSRPSKK